MEINRISQSPQISYAMKTGQRESREIAENDRDKDDSRKTSADSAVGSKIDMMA